MTILEIFTIIRLRRYLVLFIIMVFVMLGGLHSHINKPKGYNFTVKAKILPGYRAYISGGRIRNGNIENIPQFIEKLKNIEGLDAGVVNQSPYVINIQITSENYFKAYDDLGLILEPIENKHKIIIDGVNKTLIKYKKLKLLQLYNLTSQSAKSNELQGDILAIKEEMLIIDEVSTIVRPTIILRKMKKSEKDIGYKIKVYKIKLIMLYLIVGIFISIFIILMLERRKSVVNQ